MAGTPPIVANVDYNQWQNWEKVTTPDGSTSYYVVPGYNSQYVFDPFASNATGDITIYNNPKPAYDAAAKVQSQQEEAGGTSAQIAQIGGTVAGAAVTAGVADVVKNGGLAGSSVGNLLGIADPAKSVAAVAPTVLSAKTIEGVGSVAQVAAANATMEAAASGATAEVAKQAGIDAASTAGGVAETAGQVAQYAAWAYSAYQAYNVLSDPDMPDDKKAAQTAKLVGLAVADAWTFGAASFVDGVVQRSKTAQNIQKYVDPLGFAVNKWLNRPTGKQIRGERMGKLQESGVALPDFMSEDYAQQGKLSQSDLIAREQKKFEESGGAFGNAKFAESRDENDLKYTDTWGGLPWLEEFGNQYLQEWSEDQRKRVNQAVLGEGLIEEKRGQLYFRDKDRVKEIAGNVLSTPDVTPKGDYSIAYGEKGYTPRPENPGLQTPTAIGAAIDPNRIPGAHTQNLGPGSALTPNQLGNAGAPRSQTSSPGQSSEDIKQLFADMINGKQKKGVGSQPNMFT